MHTYKNIGVMLDVSRNAVMKVSEVKNYIDILAKMGYNTLELYAEDTYEIQGEPYFGYLRGAYTANELKELDAYAKGKGIELIPCIQTLAHFTNLRKVHRYQPLFDCDDILLIDDEGVYEFIDKMFQNLAENFTSRQVNIGMDEAHNVGLGKYLEKHGYCDRSELLVRHLKRVVEIADKYGFTCHMWSDMFFRLANKGEYYSENAADMEISQEVREKVPQNIALTYWDYYHSEEKVYDIMFSAHQKFNREVWFAGGAWAWSGFAPMNEYSLQTMQPAMKSAIRNGIKNIMVTVWGDNGKECSFYAVLPSLYAIRRFADGEFDMDKIKAEFKEKFNLDFDAFMALDLPSEIKVNGVPNKEWNTLCATMFYNDCFLGMRDDAYARIDPVPYGKYANLLAEYAKTAGDFAYLFDSMSKLCAFLEYKAPIGLKTREAYKSKDRAKIAAMYAYYQEAAKRLDAFAVAFKKLWMKENKAFGWEIQETRLGGLKARLLGCADRLIAYVDGQLDVIEELEAEILPCEDRNGFMYHLYKEMISPSEI